MNPISRRALLENGVRLGFAVALPSAYALRQGGTTARPQEDDLLVRIGDDSKTPLTPDDIPAGGTQTMAWAADPADNTVRSGSRLNRILLLRFDIRQLTAETKSRSAEGVIAYSAICTHTGCDVEDWLDTEQVLYCPCHSSKFDPKDNARIVDGPAPRSLPALPLKVVRGQLRVARPFLTRVGFETA